MAVSPPPVPSAGPAASYSPLSTLALPHPHILHPHACNPSMDLVVLLAPGGTAGASLKGKERAVDPELRTWAGARVGVWRMMGGKVWEVEVKGRVMGLAWTADGLYLSIVSSRQALVERQLRVAVFVEHFSVHTGELAKSANLDLAPEEVSRMTKLEGWPVDMKWSSSTREWEKTRRASAFDVLDSLPTPKPVDPPKPPVLNPFAKPPPPPNPHIPHPKLISFPSLLPALPPSRPDTLRLATPHMARTLLTGSFPLAPAHTTQDEALRLAQLSSRLLALLNVAVRGVEAIETAWREAGKQDMIWREEFETCGTQLGLSVADAHAHLFRFLVTGRGHEVVSEWLGGKLTGRWGETLEKSFQTISSLISESVLPAVQQVVLLVEELMGWQLSEFHSSYIRLDDESISRANAIATSLRALIERMKEDAKHEAEAGESWIAWLRYEKARIGASGTDELPIATHDLKLTWSYLKNAFVKSIFTIYFPDVLPRPPIDEIPEELLVRPPPGDLTHEGRTKTLLARFAPPPRPKPEALGAGDVSEVSASATQSRSSLVPSSPIEPAPAGDSEIDIEMSGVTGDADSDEAMSDVTDMPQKEEVEETPRFLDMEPWVWANSLIKACEGIVRGAIPLPADPTGEVEERDGAWREWQDGDDVVDDFGRARWYARITRDGFGVVIVRSQPGSGWGMGRLAMQGGEGWKIVALEWFDDVELALVWVDAEGDVYFGTIAYRALVEDMEMVEVDMDGGAENGSDEVHAAVLSVCSDMSDVFRPQSPLVPRSTRLHPQSPLSFKIHRARLLEIPPGANRSQVRIALNGRKGRRVGCVMFEGAEEVVVWDMDVDEDDEGEEGEDVEGEEEEEEEEEMLEE